MKITRKIVIVIILFILVGIIYFLYPKSGLFESFIFKNINKNYITQIRIDSHNLEEDKKIEDKEDIQEILFQLSKLNIKECGDYIPIDRKEAYDIRFSNGNQYISYDGAKKILDIQITFYNNGYIVLDGEGNLKSKYYKIYDSSEVDNLDKFLSKYI